jgi:alkaline phosphatase D
MIMTRREFLRMLGRAGIAMPALAGSSACAPTLTRTDTSTGLSLCYVAGDVTPDKAMVWLRAEPKSQVFLHYGKDPSLGDFSSVGPITVDGSGDDTALFKLEKLEPGTTYYYRASVAGKQPGYVARFVTAPRPDDTAKVSFCFSGDTRESYQPFTVMNAVRAQHPDFFLHLGDTIYADRGGNAHRLTEFWAKYRANREDAATQLCFAETSVYVVWDDHEITDDYLPDNPLAPIGRRAFLDYWPIARYPSEPERIYRSFRWGKALELFLLDTRQYRDRNNGTMLGKAQKEWLFAAMERSEAIFKFIGTSVPMAGGGRDRWDGYPSERAELLQYIKDKKITGVVFLSADLHCAAITRIPKGNGLRDITAGPLAAPLNRVTNGTARRFEFFLAENFNFAKITVDPKVAPPQALVEFIDQDNRVFHSAKIKAN